MVIYDYMIYILVIGYALQKYYEYKYISYFSRWYFRNNSPLLSDISS